ncbi:hypothetical protein PTKIN_Ptkin16aG0537600 [Pterospermum kingtungense]
MLIKLDLGGNNLQGEIPQSLGNCGNLNELYLSNNNLSGSIRPQIAQLSSLSVGLNLSSNHLTGVLPIEVGKLINLGILDVSQNMLPGDIANELGNCQVPVGEVFKNTSVAFLEGNNKLCGGVAEFHLPTCENLKQHRGRSTLKLIIVIISVLLGAILVFSLIFLFWFTKKRKHHASGKEENPLRVLEDGKVIAIKVVKLLSRGASRSFLVECEALRNVRHRNLFKALTVCSSVDYNSNDFKALVYEFMANRSLEDWLHPPVGMNDGEEVEKGLNLFQR